MYKKTSSVTAVILGIFMFIGFVPLAIGLYNYLNNIDASDSVKAEALSSVGTGATIVIACLLGLTLCEIAANIAAIRAAAERPMAPPHAPYPPQQPANTPYSAPTNQVYTNAAASVSEPIPDPQKRANEMIDFQCSYCDKLISISETELDNIDKMNCPHCGKVIEFEEFEE